MLKSNPDKHTPQYYAKKIQELIKKEEEMLYLFDFDDTITSHRNTTAHWSDFTYDKGTQKYQNYLDPSFIKLHKLIKENSGNKAYFGITSTSNHVALLAKDPEDLSDHRDDIVKEMHGNIVDNSHTNFFGVEQKEKI